jgi:hypothetical protein
MADNSQFLEIDYNETYKKKGLNKFLMGTASPLLNQRDFTPSIKYDAQVDRNVITKSKLAAGAVGSASLGSASVAGTNIMDGAITEIKLSDYSVTNRKLGTDAVSTVNILNASVTGAKIVSGAIAGTHLAGSAVTDTKIGNVSWNKGTAGTATFGGATNSNGIINVNDSSGSILYSFTNTGMTAGTNVLAFDSNTGTTRVTVGTMVAKTAIVPIEDSYKALYCVESPEVWFVDFVKDKFNLDITFLEATNPPYRFVQCEDGWFQVWGKRKGFENKRFESKTKDEYDKNNMFWEVK